MTTWGKEGENVRKIGVFKKEKVTEEEDWRRKLARNMELFDLDGLCDCVWFIVFFVETLLVQRN